ncbi:hypothetical protein Lser_V15G32140 [Lactuca serriola]
MAKKKATMTLKDFHGGSIPSDLPLPSAPGVTVRPLNHTGFDRHTSWTNPMGRQDHRLRPGSAGAVRTYDDKTPFLSHNVQIGRNFDEDERKPLDGGSTPRRTVSDENIRGGSGGGGGGVAVRQEPKFEYPLAGNAPTRPATTPVSQFPGGSSASYAARFSESSNVGVNSGPSPNAWGPRKVAGITEPVAASWSAPDAATKLAHASALEKVSSGRWLSNQHKQVDVEVIRHPEPEAKVQTKGNMYTTPEAARSWTTNEVVPPVAPREVPRTDVVQDLQPSEVSERPKLKLLPRSKPVENLEPLVAYKQAIPQAGEAGMVDTGNESYGNANPTEDGNQGFDRPRVNLKPRSQPIEQMERNTDRERNSLFGGARPRELVLKERGVDDVAVNHDTIQSPPNRAKKEITRADNPPVTSRQNGKPEPLDHHRTASKTRDHAEKSDAQRRSNWRNENRKIEKQPPPPPTPQERPPSPETWRKPVEPTPPVGPRYGKAASAVELAQAFSKSVSDPKVGLRGVPGQGQIPFSRLTGQPATRPHQINGH